MKKLFVLLAACCMLSAAAVVAAEEFALKDSKGRIHKLADYRGKWVLVNFWATWCAPCREEIPDLIALHKERKDLVVIGIAMEYPSEQVVMDYVKEVAIPYPIVLGNYKIAKQIGAVDALPVSYLYNPEGKLSGYQSGPITRASLEEFMRNRK